MIANGLITQHLTQAQIGNSEGEALGYSGVECFSVAASSVAIIATAVKRRREVKTERPKNLTVRGQWQTNMAMAFN